MSCGKTRYGSKKEAQTVLNERTSSGHRHGRPRFLRAYPCDECGGWHLTKQRTYKQHS